VDQRIRRWRAPSVFLVTRESWVLVLHLVDEAPGRITGEQVGEVETVANYRDAVCGERKSAVGDAVVA
jgi:hypothetical protein